MCALPSSPLMIPSLKILETGDHSELQELVNNVDLVQVRDADNNTLLHHACMLGKLEAVELLLNAGLHPNCGNVEGHTPLCDAALNGSPEIISLLLARGVNVNAFSIPGSPLICATHNGHLEAMRLLIKAGAYLNCSDNSGYCPLHIAIQRQFYSGVRVLLWAGADPNYRVGLSTPLHLAAKLNDPVLIDMLLAHGAYPNPVDKNNRTPLDYVPKGSQAYISLISAQTQVLPLQFIIRLALQRLLPFADYKELRSLGLPKALCDFLTFNEI